VDELDYIEEPQIKLNTSICRMCRNDRTHIVIRSDRDGDVAIWCPNGVSAKLSEPAPATCLYILEQTLLDGAAVPMPIVEEE
jgi:hypothetical protein